jgi:hypothetical protein
MVLLILSSFLTLQSQFAIIQGHLFAKFVFSFSAIPSTVRVPFFLPFSFAPPLIFFSFHILEDLLFYASSPLEKLFWVFYVLSGSSY